MALHIASNASLIHPIIQSPFDQRKEQGDKESNKGALITAIIMTQAIMPITAIAIYPSLILATIRIHQQAKLV
jgi:hypothetical protein